MLTGEVSVEVAEAWAEFPKATCVEIVALAGVGSKTCASVVRKRLLSSNRYPGLHGPRIAEFKLRWRQARDKFRQALEPLGNGNGKSAEPPSHTTQPLPEGTNGQSEFVRWVTEGRTRGWFKTIKALEQAGMVKIP